MCFVFWDPKDTGPNQDHPFQNNLQGLRGPSVPWSPYSGRLFSIFSGALLLGGRAQRLKRVQHYGLPEGLEFRKTHILPALGFRASGLSNITPLVRSIFTLATPPPGTDEKSLNLNP